VADSAEIMFVTRKWAPAMGGMETYCLRLTEALAKRTEIDIVALPGRSDGMPPSRLSLFTFPFAMLRRWMARKSAPRILHIGDMALWPAGLLAAFTGGRTRVLLSAHGTDVAYQRRGGIKGRLYGAYLRMGAAFLQRATVIANSHATRDVLAESGWQKTVVVPLATDMRGTPSSGIHDGTILFAGRLVERKGCGWFIRNVLPLLPEGMRLRVAGTKWHPAETAALDNPQVEFLGSLGVKELTDAYRRALCVIVPNIEVASGEYEGFGLVAVEAAAAGGLVIASDHGGLRDAVVEGETGYLVKSGDASAWRDAVLRIVGWEEAERLAFLNSAMDKAARYYSWGRVADQVMAIYEGSSVSRQA